MRLTVDPAHGLLLTNFISNGHDALSALAHLDSIIAAPPPRQRAQLTPTLLYADQAHLQGELFRVLMIDEDDESAGRVFGDLCVTDLDTLGYANAPANEIAFFEGSDGMVARAQLPAWGLTLVREQDTETATAAPGARSDEL